MLNEFNIILQDIDAAWIAFRLLDTLLAVSYANAVTLDFACDSQLWPNYSLSS